MTDRELTNEMIKRADEFVEKQKREFAISELEKIKAEILNQDQSLMIGSQMRMCLDIIDKNISELKGE